jgi:hypothetical protein
MVCTMRDPEIREIQRRAGITPKLLREFRWWKVRKFVRECVETVLIVFAVGLAMFLSLFGVSVK